MIVAKIREYIGDRMYALGRWLEMMSFAVRPPLWQANEIPSDGGLSAGVIGTASLDYNDPEVQNALVRGYIAEKRTSIPSDLITPCGEWAGPNWNEGNSGSDGVL